MAENLALNSVENIVPHSDISILIIDHDIASITSLTSMLQQFSYKVMSLNVASEAIEIIKTHKNIGLVIANTEMLHIDDSNSFFTDLLKKDIPLILTSSDSDTAKTSDLMTKGASFCLKTPISEKDMKNVLQHVLPNKLSEDKVMDECTKQMETFRESLKRQRQSQASLLGSRRPFNETFSNFNTYQKRRHIANVEWKNNTMFPFKFENKRSDEGKKVESNVRRRCNIWTHDRHMKFLAAISILGDQKSRPKAILEIMNDPNLTHRQVASHLQKYKGHVEQISDTIPKNEWKTTDKTFEYPSDYEYSFKTSNLTKNLISYNSLWYSLRKKTSSSSSMPKYSFKKPAGLKKENKLKFHQGENFSNILNNSLREVSNIIPSTSKYNHPNNVSSTEVNQTGLVSIGSPDRFESPTFLSETDLNQIDSNHSTSNYNPPNQTGLVSIGSPNPFQSPTFVPETDLNQIDSNPFMPYSHVPQLDSFPDFTMNPFETNLNQTSQTSVLPETDKNITVPETNANHIDGSCCDLFQDMIFPEIPTSLMDLIYSEGSYVPPENLTSNETNTTQAGLVPNEEDQEIPIEEMINFDDDINEMDLLENYTSSEETDTSGNEPVFDTSMDLVPQIIKEDYNPSSGSTSLLENMLDSNECGNVEAMNQGDYLEGENNFSDDPNFVKWFDEMMENDA